MLELVYDESILKVTEDDSLKGICERIREEKNIKWRYAVR